MCALCNAGRRAHTRHPLPQDALAASFQAKDAAGVAAITRDLLASLGDPYTRLLQGDEEAALTAEQEGKVRLRRQHAAVGVAGVWGARGGCGGGVLGEGSA